VFYSAWQTPEILFISVLDYFDFKEIYTSFLKSQWHFLSILKFFRKKEER